jgi:tetraacyldisaccharide 4'-kinase
MTLSRIFLQAWRRRGMLPWLLLPFSGLFMALLALRRLAYRCGWLGSERLTVPVVVVGNILVGGAGKTPLTLWLAGQLRAAGRRPGIVSRGYRADAAGTDGPREVLPESEAALVGDEPLLLCRRAGVPVFVGRDRVAAGRALLAAHPECDVILCDDGLQHVRLARDFEIAVVDGRGLMNGWLLPAGPLREPARRLAAVDALVMNGEDACVPACAADRPVFRMRLVGSRLQRLDDAAITCAPADLAGLRLAALAGIAVPERFFTHLAGLGLQFSRHVFADHHAFCADDLLAIQAATQADVLLMTEKDAVKCATFATGACPVWVLPVTAEVEPDPRSPTGPAISLVALIEQRLVEAHRGSSSD